MLTGKNGQLGWELARSLARLGEVNGCDRELMNLADPDAMVKTMRTMRPQLIVNAAAYTAVDRAESEPELAHKINAVAPRIIADEAQALGAAIIHYSTDYVFDGDDKGARVESDPPNPRSAYGRSKLAGEQAVAASGAAHCIFRTSWVYASRGKNFLLTMLRLAREKPELRVIADQIGAPTWARVIAEATANVIGQLTERGTINSNSLIDAMRACGGIYHLTASGSTSWHGFAQTILREAGLTTPLQPITTAEYPLPASRPANSRLSCARLGREFGIVLPAWETSLHACMAELETQLPLR